MRAYIAILVSLKKENLLSFFSEDHYCILNSSVIHSQFLFHKRYIYDFVVLYLCKYLFLWGTYEQNSKLGNIASHFQVLDH